MAMNTQLTIILLVAGLISRSTSDDIAERLKKRYDNVAEKCVDSNTKEEKPAFECSGIMIRGVRTDVKLDYAWGMKDKNKEKDAFSLAYLRSDQKFSTFPRGYDSGFIVYPHMKTPVTKNKYKVYCSFPMDAHTDGREGHGCGKLIGDAIGGSSHCDTQNINSFSAWKQHYNQIMNSANSMDRNLVTRQCAFDMRTKSRVKDFVISLKANRYIQSHSKVYALRNNELRMHAWSAKRAKNIPIEAFFYLMGSAQGKMLAEKYQDEFFAKSGGEIVPIVGIRLPTETKKFKVESYKRTPRKH